MIEQPNSDLTPMMLPLDDMGDMLVTQPTTGSLQRIEAEARAMHTAYQLASSLSKTAMVPEQYQQSAHGDTAAYNLCAAILYGAELGLSAVQSAQNIFIVRGKPAIYSTTMAAVIRRAGFVMEEVEATDERVVWKALRDDTWAFSEWSMERAKQAGYTSNKLYQTNPVAMLRAKCIAELARIKFQDCITGLSQSIEELQLDNVTVQRVVKRETRGAAALREIAAAAEEQARSLPDKPVVSGTPDRKITPEQLALADDEPASTEQLDTIRKLYDAKAMNGKAVLDDVAQFLQLDQKLSSLNKLRREDADAVLVWLQATPAS